MEKVDQKWQSLNEAPRAKRYEIHFWPIFFVVATTSREKKQGLPPGLKDHTYVQWQFPTCVGSATGFSLYPLLCHESHSSTIDLSDLMSTAAKAKASSVVPSPRMALQVVKQKIFEKIFRRT